ncbi:RNA exonuclease 4 [Psidium guajava]|nr:RNA exonuclease 4 [Psidium guajava]
MSANKSAMRRPNRPSLGEKDSRDWGFHFPGKFTESEGKREGKKKGGRHLSRIEAEKRERDQLEEAAKILDSQRLSMSMASAS